MKTFSIASPPFLHFGAGKISDVSLIAKSFGSRVLLITGANSFLSSAHGGKLLTEFDASKLDARQYWTNGEPTPAMIDTAVKTFAPFDPHVVVAIGGGSVLDAGKAISAMLRVNEPVKHYLEGVGPQRRHPGTKVPLIAVPTTAGTGSEATKNAVLAEVGSSGYKKSLRHDNFIPDVAIVDPALTLSCPSSVTAASGMDAFTQLLESYLSTASNAITDALSFEGLTRINASLVRVFQQGSNVDERANMSLAAYLSGVTLANAGLGTVHGFASSIGGFFDIPHGVICSTLMAPVNKLTVLNLRAQDPRHPSLSKYETVGKIFNPATNKPNGYYTDYLLALIEKWAAEMKIPTLSSFGVCRSDFPKIVAHTSNKNNPAVLDNDELTKALMIAG